MPKYRIENLIGKVISLVYSAWSGSWRRNNDEAEQIDELIRAGNRVIVVCWHGKFLPLFSLLAHRDMAVTTSDCFRGRIISQICHRFGHKPTLTPKDGQGNKYRHFLKQYKDAKSGAIAVDGPLGPNHIAKPGAIQLASSLGYIIVPVSVACSAKRVATERWDDREFPRWGSKVSLVVGDPITIPKGLRSDDLPDWCEKVAAAINAVDKRADEVG